MIVKLAHEMMDCIDRLNAVLDEPVSLLIDRETGPVVAGVNGKRNLPMTFGAAA